MELTDQFWLPSDTIDILRAMHNYTPKSACREVFRMWLDGGDDLLVPKDWNSVIEMVGRLGNSGLGKEIRAVLTTEAEEVGGGEASMLSPGLVEGAESAEPEREQCEGGAGEEEASGDPTSKALYQGVC